MDYNRKLTETLAFVGALAPASQAVSTITAGLGPVNMNIIRRLMAIVNVGVVTTGTVDFQFQSSTTSGGAYTLIPGAQIVQITASNKIALLELSIETLMNLGVGPWVRGALIIGTAASFVSVEMAGGASRYEPSSDYNVAPFQTPVAV